MINHEKKSKTLPYEFPEESQSFFFSKNLRKKF